MRAVLLLCGVLASGAALAQPAGEGVFGSPSRFTETSGAAIYRNVCAGCHMPQAQGAAGAGVYPALAADPRLAAAGYPVGVVVHGQRAMPPFGNLLTNQQIADVVGYVRQNFGNAYLDMLTPDEVQAAR